MSALRYPVEWLDTGTVELASRRTRSSGAHTVRFLRAIATGTRPAHEPLLETLDQRLSEVSGYQANWDGNDSEAPSADAIAKARGFLQEVFRSAVEQTSGDWRSPHISANEEGHIVFEWWNGQRKLTIYFGPQSASFIRSWGPHLFDDMQDGPLVIEEFGNHWAWLLG
jgi:hypothetical protein